MNKKAKGLPARIGVLAMVSAVAVLACPMLAFASEGGDAGISAILPDMQEFIPMLVAFILLWIVLAKFGWPIFNNMLKTRENTIKDALDKAEQAREESERLLQEYREQLDDAKNQASQIVAEAKKTGEAMKADITDKAQVEANLMIEKAKAAIESEKKAAVAELQGSVVDLSLGVASKFIGQELSDDEHRAIIERYVSEAGGANVE